MTRNGIAKDAKWRERHGREVSRFSRPFVGFVVRIDALVYELYGLTEEEIGVVEGRLDRE